MAVTIEPIKGIMVGSYGQGITITVVNEDGVAQDISGYTEWTIVGLPPDGRGAKTATAAYSGNGGTDGVLTFSWASGDIDRSGTWKVQAELSKSGEIFKTYFGEMEVGIGLRSA
jgi:hypothetical protein